MAHLLRAATPTHRSFVPVRAQILNQQPELVDC
jgi:hypothetical protein